MGTNWFRYGEERLPYKVCYTPNRKTHITINVHPTGLVHVDAPEGTDDDAIRRALMKRARWIKTRRDMALKSGQAIAEREYVSGESQLYLGRRYKLVVHQRPGCPPVVKLHHGRLQVTLSQPDKEVVRAHLLAWYRERARTYFQRRLEAVIPTMPWVPEHPPIQLKAMTRQWGSCSAQGSLTLNPALVKAPRDCVDYVIIHELCHIKEHNHSPAFYALLDRLMPGWQSVKARLDGMVGEMLAG